MCLMWSWMSVWQGIRNLNSEHPDYVPVILVEKALICVSAGSIEKFLCVRSHE